MRCVVQGQKIMDDEKKCFLCGQNGGYIGLERHHIFFNTANRPKSEKYGLVVYLCAIECHRLGKKAVHQCEETMDYLHQYGQRKFMEEQNATIEEFKAVFGKNYL